MMSNCLLLCFASRSICLRACAIVDAGVQIRFQTTINTNAPAAAFADLP